MSGPKVIIISDMHCSCRLCVLLNHYVYELENTLTELRPGKPTPFGLNELLNGFENYKLFFLYRLTFVVPFFWAGQMDSGSLDVETNIDTVLKSTKYISLFNGWVEYFLSGSRSVRVIS